MSIFRTEVKKTVKVESVTDLREKDFSGISLSNGERLALSRYDAYRIWYLNSSETEDVFHKRYQELQAKAMLAPWAEFLSDSYSIKDSE